MDNDRDYYIVMIEQYYANNVSVLAVCKTLEDAERIGEESRLGSDIHIYSGMWNEEYPTV